MTKGIKTSEFLWSAVSSVTMFIYGMQEESAIAKNICLAGAVVLPLIYSLGRTLLKLEEQKIINLISDEHEAVLRSWFTHWEAAQEKDKE